MEQRKEKVLQEATVCFLYKDGKVLLARKTDKIGKGKLNGYGGGIEKGETVPECAVRELREESGVTAETRDLEKIAIVHFHNTKSDGGTFVLTVHFYLVHKWKGEPVKTKEMASPDWYEVTHLPVNDMMPSDREWLPQALNGNKLIAHAYLGPFQKEKTKETEITIVDDLNE